MDLDKISILNREPSIDATYQISVHLGKRFQRRRRFFRNQPIRNKTPVVAMFVTDRDEMSIFIEDLP
jgi:hypothetical protein